MSSSEGLHRHLARQLRKLGLDPAAPPSADAWKAFLLQVGQSYEDTDLERYTLERSVGLFEREMSDLNRRFETERDRLRLIIEAAPTGILSTDMDGRVTMANPAITQILGYTSEELTGVDRAELVHPDERTTVTAMVGDFRDGRIPVGLRTPRRFLHRDGHTVQTNLSFAVVRDPDQCPLFTLVLVEDVSERMRLEVELRQAQKLESVGRLASGIAHELNTPIQFIGDNAHFLESAFGDLRSLCIRYREVLERLGDLVSPETRDVVARAEEQSDLPYVEEHAPAAFGALLQGVSRVSTIVQAMKAFAQPDQGQKVMADVNQALKNTLAVLAHELANVAVVDARLDEPQLVDCQVGELNQVFLNLLMNAAHAIGDVVGQGVASGATKGEIRVRSVPDAGWLTLSISDTGTGITPAVASRLFEPFFTTKEVGRGTGQGLAISRSIVERHGGTLTFETEVGRGTTFCVRLPLSGKARTPLHP